VGTDFLEGSHSLCTRASFLALEKCLHGSCGDLAGVALEVIEDAISAAAGGFEVGGF
jgi:hypothetical protein